MEFAELLHKTLTEPELTNDFMNFNKEIDKVKAEKGLSEIDAIELVSSYWSFPKVDM